MKIVLIDQFGCFASVVIAAYCTGLLSSEANYREILNLPFFANRENVEPGKLYYVGKDLEGTEFYTLGAGAHSDLIVNVVWLNLLKISNIKENVFLYDVNTFNLVHLNYLEIFSKGKLRKISKYIWAYWFFKLLKAGKLNLTK